MEKNKYKKCYLCGNNKFEKISNRVRDIKNKSVLQCKKCELVFLENFNHIKNNFYEKSKMRQGEEQPKGWKAYLDKCAQDDFRRAEFLKKEVEGKSLLDFGCGAGGFLSMLKNIKKITGVEKDEKIIKKIQKNFNLKIYEDLGEIREKFDVITLFHVIEHLKNPKKILERLRGFLNPEGKIIIETPNSSDALLTLYNCRTFSDFYYWSCHLHLFNEKSIKLLLKKCGYQSAQVVQIQRYPLSNHLYWLARRKPDGHKIWNFLNNKELNILYQNQLAKKGICDTILVIAINKKK